VALIEQMAERRAPVARGAENIVTPCDMQALV
jgi:hypothetical protein